MAIIQVLYKFGSVGYFRETIKSKDGLKNWKFSHQSSTRIALGCSDYTNGMKFWDPTMFRLLVSADYSRA
jgi:hypothetical protein